MSRSLKAKFDRLDSDEQISLMFDLINAFNLVKSPYKTALLLQDLLTANEIRNLSIRLRIAKLILSGHTHRQIMAEIHSSLATISKVRAWLDSGGSGFKEVIAKLPVKWKIPKKFPKGPLEFHLPQILLYIAEYSLSNSQNKNVINFNENLKEKENIDRILKKYFNEIYKDRSTK